MSFFTTDTPVPTPPTLAPLGRDRITAVLEAREMRYGIDDDGDVGGYWDGHLFYFFLLGEHDEHLQVRGRWNREVGADQLPAVLAAVNEWNVSHLWPKGCVAVEDDVLGVYAEHTVDYQHGVSDAQVDLHLGCGISSALQLFAHLDELYPAEAAAARAEQERAQGQG
ncbi:YbjN domain-containing protein [Cellulomonas xiejunii]|uniref:YbjN domain-containing protein n=1 Tax=Cellulomonas xiejunii TaxID=2968083 RepID=A0ABY5KKZ3_9CELL|nr:YbjN domain-containing protein [Cellulomonas xiejunii]MCC2315778.1 YbjN domain-containing protein [Cellulomonas xiejunii]MCC2320875.1 YbjN domain-containing protein [Cellulomonas xiejunii]UUI71157.1 YbjN domain-containing protein [Cellulomonas xiejunii]